MQTPVLTLDEVLDDVDISVDPGAGFRAEVQMDGEPVYVVAPTASAAMEELAVKLQGEGYVVD